MKILRNLEFTSSGSSLSPTSTMETGVAVKNRPAYSASSTRRGRSGCEKDSQHQDSVQSFINPRPDPL